MARAELTVLDHLSELRQRLIKVLLGFVLTFGLGLYWSPRLYGFLTSNLSQKLLVLGPNDILWIYVRLATILSISLLFPLLTYQVWAYVRPALTKQEAAALVWYLPASFVCFVAGLAFGFYLVTPALLKVLLSLGEDQFTTQLTAQNYLAFVQHTTLPLGLIFEWPVVISFLTQLGLISPSYLQNHRRYAYFGLICLAVILTPADLFSDLVMSLPLILVYEVGIMVSRMIEGKRRKKYGNTA